MHVVITSNGQTQVYSSVGELIASAPTTEVAQTAKDVSAAFDLIGMILTLFFWYVILELAFIILTMIFSKDNKPKTIIGYVFWGISQLSWRLTDGYRHTKEWCSRNIIQKIVLWNSRSKTMKFKKNPEFDEMEAWQAKKAFSMEHNGCKVDIKPGDWVGQDGFGNLKVYSDDVFRKAYVGVPETDVAPTTKLPALSSGE